MRWNYCPRLWASSLWYIWRMCRRAEYSPVAGNSVILAGAVFACAIQCAQAQTYVSNLPTDHPAILYQSADLDDAATRLGRQLAAGRGKPDLPSLLEYFRIHSHTP